MFGQRWTDENAIIGYLSPYYHNTGSQTIGPAEVWRWGRMALTVQEGPLAANATVDAYLQGSADNSTWTTLSGKSITQQTAAHGEQIIECRRDELPSSYLYLRGILHVGTAPAYVAAQLIGSNPRFAPAYEQDHAIVDEIVPTP